MDALPPTPPMIATYSPRFTNWRRLTIWAIILLLAASTAMLIAVTGVWTPPANSAVSVPPAIALPGDTPMQIPLAPGTDLGPALGQTQGAGQGDSGAVNALPDKSPAGDQTALQDAGDGLGNAANGYRQQSIYVGYTVPTGTVESSASAAVNDATHQFGATLLYWSTKNNGGPAVLHTDLIFAVPQGRVDGFLDNLGKGGDYQIYGKQASTLDRNSAYEAVIAQAAYDAGQIKGWTAQLAQTTDPAAQQELQSRIQPLQHTVDQLRAAVSAADGNQTPTRVRVSLDERRAESPGSLQAAWLLGSRNVITIATAILFLAITAFPIAILLVPGYLVVRRRMRRRNGIMGA